MLSRVRVEGHRSLDIMMKKGPKAYHLAFVAARANGIVGGSNKTGFSFIRGAGALLPLGCIS